MKKGKKIKKIKNVLDNIMFLLIILIIISTLYSLKKQEKYGPKQTKAQGNTTISKDNYKADITYLAKYEISGKVVEVHDYTGDSIGDLISPRDVGICWGFLAEDKYQIKTVTGKARHLNYTITNRDIGYYINKILGRVNSHISNNHLVPSDKNTSKLINKIQVNDFITLEGYLVNVYAEAPSGKTISWESSLSRNDVGDGACELLYVTNVTWLNKDEIY